MATGTITHNSKRKKILNTLIITPSKVVKTLNLAYTMLFVQGRISQKNTAFYVPIGCVRFARYCGKIIRAVDSEGFNKNYSHYYKKTTSLDSPRTPD